MINAGRLKEQMEQEHLSQSELARRIGVSQTTIRKLVSGAGYGSKYIHKIARELGTTPAYLVGETDDPEADAPPPPVLDHVETELIDCFRVLTPADRAVIMHLVRSLAGQGAEPRTFHSPALNYEGRR